MNQGRVLAVVYSPRSRPWSEILEAGSDLFRFLWIIDSREPGISTTAKALRKTGKVIDAAGCTAEQLIQLVHAERPDGITAFFDTDLHRQAWLAEALGLPSPTVRAAARLTDKLLQREAHEAAGVPVPKFSAVREPGDRAEVERLCETLNFPMVLKPRDGTSSCNVFPVANADELIRLLGDLEHPSRMILEERMNDLPSTDAPYASHIQIDTIVSRGIFSHLGITGLFPKIAPLRSSGGFFPADVPAADVPKLFDMATSAIRALGADFGCYRTEIKLSPEGRRIIEVNGRPSGLTPPTVSLASGLPVLQLCMRLAVGDHIIVEGPVACDRVAYRYYREPPMTAKTVRDITGLDTLSDWPGVIEIDVFKTAGASVDWRNGSLDRVFQVTGVVADHAELAEHHRACSEVVRVRYDEPL